MFFFLITLLTPPPPPPQLLQYWDRKKPQYDIYVFLIKNVMYFMKLWNKSGQNLHHVIDLYVSFKQMDLKSFFLIWDIWS